VDLYQASGREKRSTFVKVVVACLMAFIIAPPLASAATSVVKIKDSGGGAIEASKVDPMGLFGAAGSSGAVAVRNFAGGGGFLGAADCTESTADGLTNVVSVTNSIVTGMIFTGTDGTFTVTSDAVGAGVLPLLKFRVSTATPNEFVGLGNGLTLTDALTITCTGTNGNVVVLGQ
jgi:hypothetical protein